MHQFVVDVYACVGRGYARRETDWIDMADEKPIEQTTPSTDGTAPDPTPQRGGIVEKLKGGIVSTFLITLGFWAADILLTSLGTKVINPLLTPVLSALFDSTGVSYFFMYFDFIYGWLAVVLLLLIVGYGRKYLKAFGTAPSGNRPSYLLAGLAIGLAMNAFCIGVAVLRGNISGFEFVGFEPVQIILFVVVVLIQCSLEEIEARGFIFQRVRHCYGPAVAMVANSLYFALEHLLNGGINPLALTSIFAVGIVLSLATYNFDSLWMAFGIHTGWNFCQGVLFGLPNSGVPTGYAIFRPVGELTDSFAYDTAFGVESTVVAIALFAVVSVLICLWGRKHPRRCYDVFEA